MGEVGMQFTNADKQQHGQSAQNGLEAILGRCKEQGYLQNVVKDYRKGRPEFGNDAQFYAPFLVEFHDGSKWLLYTTTSFRSDRIKGQQWDAMNLREIDPYISRAYLVYPGHTSIRAGWICKAK